MRFKDALTRLKEIYHFDGGELESFYNQLRHDHQLLTERALGIESRMARVDQTAQDLFEEWQQEIDQINNAKFKRQSRQSLSRTKARYQRMYAAMARAHASMEPVLGQLQDYVLYLKHNLNAQAIGALKQEVNDIELEVRRLIADISRSIQEADEFLKAIE